MSSPPPLSFDTYYHIYNRGINRENVFIEARNYTHFLRLYTEYVEPVAETFAYCLLRNHFHLLVRVKAEAEVAQTHIPKVLKTFRVSPKTTVSKQFSDFFNAYAKAINNTYKRTGSLFQHPFGRVVIEDDRQFCNVVAYIHQNPEKHGFVTDFREWPYSSYHTLLSDRPTRLHRRRVLDWFGGATRFAEAHAEWLPDAQTRWFAGEDVV